MYSFDVSEIEKQVLDFMQQIDAYPLKSDRLILDGELHRYSIEGDKSSQKNGAYRIFTDGIPAGFIQDWRKGTKTNWKFDTGNTPRKTLDYFESKEFNKELYCLKPTGDNFETDIIIAIKRRETGRN